MGMGFLPMPGMFGSPTPSATDAAALGMTAPQRGGMMGMGGTTMSNPYMNPMASPFLYGSMFPMTQQQAGVYDAGGPGTNAGYWVGSVEWRAGPAPALPGAVRAGKRSHRRKNRGTTGQPGGLAARYFNRTTQKPRIPQGFYNRQNQHYPQVGR